MMKLNEGQMKANLNNSTLRPNNPSKGWSALALGTAKVQMINWEELRCTIKVLDGEFEEPIYDGVELLFPASDQDTFSVLSLKSVICVLLVGLLLILKVLQAVKDLLSYPGSLKHTI